MNYLLELLFISWVDPFMWFKSMSVLGYRRGKRQCVAATIGYYWFIIVKELIGNCVDSGAIAIITSIALTVYVFFMSVWLFSGDLTERVVSVCLYFSILYVTELVIFRLVLIGTQGTSEWLMTNPIANMGCAVVAQLLQAAAFYWTFGKRKYKSLFYLKHEVVLAIIVLPTIIQNLLFSNTGMLYRENASVFNILVQYVLLSYILAISMILKKKENYITNLSEELNSSSERKELLQELEHFKHDYAAHGSVMLRLLERREYELLEEYMRAVFENVEKTEECYDHPNLVVAILISQLKQKARNAQCSLDAMIQVEDFGMQEEELSSLLYNLVMNGLEAAQKVPGKCAAVSLEAVYTRNGYLIRCYNPSKGAASLQKTSKPDKREHGFGVAIIDKIVRKYHGTVERSCEETATDSIYLVVVTIQIPYKHNKLVY